MPSPTALTTFDTEFRSRLATGLVVSLVAHLCAGLALMGGSGDFAGDVRIIDSLQPPEPEEPLVRPGIARSRAVTINWLGFDAPTEHEAATAEVEQAALSPEAPGIEAPEVAEPAPLEVAADAPAGAPEESPNDETAPAEPDASEAATEGVELAETSETEQPSLLAPLLPAAEAVAEEAGAIAAQLVQVVRRTIAEAGEIEPREAAQPREAGAPETPAGKVPDAIESEKESPATSLDAVKWNPGRPLAAEGLDITPVHPRWNIATLVSAMPKNPVVRLDFGKDGRVKKAEFLPGRSTGYRDVDGPLLDALYRWTAKGEALEKLPDGAEAVVSLPVEIVLIRPRGPIERSSSDR